MPASSSATVATTDVALAGRTDAGLVRAVNQDSFLAERVPGKGWLAVVADGMGGHQMGELASQTAVEALRRELERIRTHPPTALARAAQAANLEVYNEALERPESRGMGTTLTTVLIDDQVGLVGHVGDSRAYLIRGGTIRQLTQDHSWVAERVRQGLLTEDEARRHRFRNVITNALGATETFKLDMLHFEIAEGDRVLVCSDGVSMLLSDTMMRQIVEGAPPDEAAEQLIAEANDRGSPDNVTVVVAEVRRLATHPKRYALPPAADEPSSVKISGTMSGIREIEETFPARNLLATMRKQPWYPYRVWIVGSLYLVLLFLLFSLFGR